MCIHNHTHMYKQKRFFLLPFTFYKCRIIFFLFNRAVYSRHSHCFCCLSLLPRALQGYAHLCVCVLFCPYICLNKYLEVLLLGQTVYAFIILVAAKLLFLLMWWMKHGISMSFNMHFSEELSLSLVTCAYPFILFPWGDAY